MIMAIFGFLARRGREISTPRKIAIGMFIAGLAFLFLAVFSMMKGYPSADTFKGLPIAEQMAAKAHWWVLIVTYFFLTVAELFISPLGLSFVSKVAPKSMLGLCQGLWLAATALGNLLLWIARSCTTHGRFGNAGHILDRMSCIYGSYAWYGEMA